MSSSHSFNSKLLQSTGRLFLSQGDQNESHPQPLILPNDETRAKHERSNLFTALDLLTKPFGKQEFMIG